MFLMTEPILEGAETLAAEAPWLLAIVAILALAAIYVIVKLAVKIAVRVALVGAVVLAALFAVGYIG